MSGSDLSAESADAINDGLSFFSTFLLAVAAVSLFVSAFIVYNTFAIVVAQRTREMALLRALGADGEQVVGSILLESLMIRLLASGAGLIGGIGMAVALKQLLSAIGFDVPSGTVVVLPRTILVSIAAVGCSGLVLGVALVVLGALSVSTAWLDVGSVLSVLAVALLAPSIVAPFVAVLAALVLRLRGVPGQLAEENASRSARRRPPQR